MADELRAWVQEQFDYLNSIKRTEYGSGRMDTFRDVLAEIDRRAALTPPPPTVKGQDVGVVEALRDRVLSIAHTLSIGAYSYTWAIGAINGEFRKAEAALSASPPPAVSAPSEGWVLVPKKPTPEMYAAGWKRANEVAPNKLGIITDTAAGDIYRAMIAAAPPVKSDEGGRS